LGTPAADSDFGALLLADADVALDALTLAGSDERTDGRLGVEGVADDLVAQLLGDALGHLVVAVAGGEDAGLGHARLAVDEDGAAEKSGDGLVEVGVVEDDGGRLAAQLEGDAPQALAAQRRDALAGGGAAGEADLVDVGVGDEVLAHGPVGGDDVEHA